MPLLEWLPLELSRLGLLTFCRRLAVVSFWPRSLPPLAPVWRVWGTAWLGAATVQHGEMQAGAVMADGPYRYVRNPLYLGVWFMFAALALSHAADRSAVYHGSVRRVSVPPDSGRRSLPRPPSLASPTCDYLRAVPRLIPRLRTTLAPTGRKPTGSTPCSLRSTPSAFSSLLAFCRGATTGCSWRRVIVVSFGLSLVVRAFMPRLSMDR